MKAFIGWMLLSLSFTLTAHADPMSCDFLDSKGLIIGHAATNMDNEASAQVYSAQTGLVVLDGKLFVKETFELEYALDGTLEPVKKIFCY